jgi:dihydroorotase
VIAAARDSLIVLSGVSIAGGPPVDLYVEHGRVAELRPAGHGKPVDGAVANTYGLIVLPGLVDLHCHLREPAGDVADPAETIESGTWAAAAGGYTDVFAMANTTPPCDSAVHVRDVLVRAENRAAVRVYPVGAITVGLAGATLAPIEEMAVAGARMFSDDGHCVDDSELMQEVLTVANEHGLVIAQHAQDARLAGRGQINDSVSGQATGLPPWPAAGEEVIVARDVVLAGHTGGHLHVCHVSTAGTVEIIRWAKSRGWPVTAEVTPHHLMLTDELAARTDPLFKVNPPLRSSADVAALRRGLRDGTIDAVATDHAPHTAAAKATRWTEAPFGMTGLETALPVVASVLAAENGTVDWPHLAALMSHGPARIGGIDTIAGRPVEVGEAATFCLVDPTEDWVVDPRRQISRSSNTPFRGARFQHRVVATFIDGCLAYATHPSLGRVLEIGGRPHGGPAHLRWPVVRRRETGE